MKKHFRTIGVMSRFNIVTLGAAIIALNTAAGLNPALTQGEELAKLLRDGGMFAAAVNYPAGDGPQSVAISDLDGDQVPDLAVANHYSNNVSVLLGLGDGTFAAAANYAVGDEPCSVAIGDLDGDGDDDLAVANLDGCTVSVLLNHGDGTFANDVMYGTATLPWSVAIADLDGDGDNDLAVANYASDNVSVLLNHGNGTFANDVTYAVGNAPISVAIADLDGDGDDDLAVANQLDVSVSILLNHGNGTFVGDVTYAVGSGPYSVTIADLDGDGDDDLAVTNYSDGGESESVSILLNHGDGTFAAHMTYGVEDHPASVAIADLDGDDDPDLAVVNHNTNTVSILLNHGDGTFADDTTYSVGDHPFSVAIADLDGDGWPDLAVANYWSDNVSVLLNQSASGNQPPVADAGGPYTGSIGEEITFDASASYDPDGTIVGYRWDWTNDGEWDTDWLTEPFATFIYDAEFHGQVALEVMDNENATDTDTAQVDIVPNAPPVADADGPYAGMVGRPILFDATGSYDPNGGDLEYRWDWTDDGEWDTDWLPDAVLAHIYEAEFEGQARLEVKDDEGETDSDTASVTVGPAGITYQYDALNRLVQVTYADGSAIVFEYDAVGNRTLRVTNGDTNVVYLAVHVDPPGSGTVTREPDLIWYPLGSQVVLTAEIGACEFGGWSGNVPPGHQYDNPLTLTMDNYRSVTLHLGPPVGDLNCDCAVNAFDIDPFVLALTDPDGYAAAWPDCDRMLADCNGDGEVNAFDIDPFVELLIGP